MVFTHGRRPLDPHATKLEQVHNRWSQICEALWATSTIGYVGLNLAQQLWALPLLLPLFLFCCDIDSVIDLPSRSLVSLCDPGEVAHMNFLLLPLLVGEPSSKFLFTSSTILNLGCSLSHAISLHSNHWATFNIPGSLVHIHTSLHSSTSFNLLERLLYHSRYAKQLPRKTC